MARPHPPVDHRPDTQPERRAGFGHTIRLGRIAGIPIGAHWGLLVIAALYLTTLGGSVLPTAAPDAGARTHWLVAGAGVVAFIGSILAHEVGHALAARHAGIGVRAITLWLLGGVTELERDAETARHELWIALSGPLVNVGLGVAFVASAVGYEAVFGASVVSAMVLWLGLVNGLLAVLNLLPATPFDGGRVLTAAVWWRTGDPNRGRAVAARAGRIAGVGLAIVGLWMLGRGGGLWILLLAWFVYSGASAEATRAAVLGRAARTTVGALMRPLGAPVEGAVTVAGLDAMQGRVGAAFPVLVRGEVTGVVPAHRISAAVRQGRSDAAASELVVPWAQFVSARSDEMASAVIERARGIGDLHVLVYDPSGRQVGYLGMPELTGATERALVTGR